MGAGAREQGRAAAAGARGQRGRARALHVLKAAALCYHLGRFPQPRSSRALPGAGEGRLWPGLGEREKGGCLPGLARLCQIPVLQALKDAVLCAGLARSPPVLVARGSGTWGTVARV